MLVVIAILLALILATLLLGGIGAFSYLRVVVRHVADNNRMMIDKLEGIKKEVDKKGYVADPFKVANKTNNVGAATSHIVPRNSPDYIRNKNAEAIKAGLGSYGSPE